MTKTEPETLCKLLVRGQKTDQRLFVSDRLGKKGQYEIFASDLCSGGVGDGRRVCGASQFREKR